MHSTIRIKNLGLLKQNAKTSIGQDGRVHTNAEVNNERPGGAFNLSAAKFDEIPTASRKKSLTEMNDEQCNAQGLTKSLQRSLSTDKVWTATQTA